MARGLSKPYPQDTVNQGNSIRQALLQNAQLRSWTEGYNYRRGLYLA